jgi:hypothetical protein
MFLRNVSKLQLYHTSPNLEDSTRSMFNFCVSTLLMMRAED